MFYATILKFAGNAKASGIQMYQGGCQQYGSKLATSKLPYHRANIVSELHCASPCCIDNERLSFSMSWLPCFFGFRQSTALFAHEVHFSVLFSVSTTTADLRGLPLCSEHDSLCLNSSAIHKAIHLSFIDQGRPLTRS